MKPTPWIKLNMESMETKEVKGKLKKAMSMSAYQTSSCMLTTLLSRNGSSLVNRNNSAKWVY